MVILGTVAGMAIPHAAVAAIGDLSYQGCISSNTDQTTCTQLGASSPGGNNTPLSQTIAAAQSPDGANLYVTAGDSDSVVTFSRDPATGALTFVSCLTADTDTVGCARIPGATAGGVNNGVDAPFAIAVSADGKSLYTANLAADSIAHYVRDTATGALTYGGCVSSDSAQSTKCVMTPVNTAGGDKTALAFPDSVVVSPDGSSVYVAGSGGSAIARFNRDPVTGAFGGFAGCITGDTDVSANPAVTKCTAVAGAKAGGGNTGLSGLNAVAVSPDSKTVYAVARFDDDLMRFSRNTATGDLTFQGCVSADVGATTCVQTPVTNTGGQRTGLDSPFELAVSPDNANVYVAALDGDAVARFKIDPAAASGLSFQDCLTSDSAVVGCTLIPGAAAGDDNSPLDSLGVVAVSPNGTSVYAGAGGGDALTRFDRDATTGALSFNSCTTSNTDVGGCAQLPGATPKGTNTPLGAVEDVIPSTDGKNVYTLGVAEAVSRFDVEGLPPTPPVPPNNDFTVSVSKNKRKGTAALTISVPGPGEIALTGNGVASKAATAPDAGDVALKLKATDNKRKKLRRRGKVKVTAQITFTPTGGSANTEPSKIKLVRR